MNEVRTSDLIAGTDGEFVTNAYCALLGRLPEPASLENYMGWLAHTPTARPAILKHIAESEEFRQRNAITYLEDDVEGADLEDPKVLLAAMQRFQLPIMRSMVIATSDSVYMAGLNIDQALQDLVFEAQRGLGSRAIGLGGENDMETDQRLSALETESASLRLGVEELKSSRQEMTRNLVEHFVNLLQVQLVTLDERLAKLESALGARR